MTNYITTEQQDIILKKLDEMKNDINFLYNAILNGKSNVLQERVINAAIENFNKIINS